MHNWSEIVFFAFSKFLHVFQRSIGRLNDGIFRIFELSVKWGAPSQWSFRPNSAWGSLKTTTIARTHPTLWHLKSSNCKTSKIISDDQISFLGTEFCVGVWVGGPGVQPKYGSLIEYTFWQGMHWPITCLAHVGLKSNWSVRSSFVHF